MPEKFAVIFGNIALGEPVIIPGPVQLYVTGQFVTLTFEVIAVGTVHGFVDSIVTNGTSQTVIVPVASSEQPKELVTV